MKIKLNGKDVDGVFYFNWFKPAKSKPYEIEIQTDRRIVDIPEMSDIYYEEYKFKNCELYGVNISENKLFKYYFKGGKKVADGRVK